MPEMSMGRSVTWRKMTAFGLRTSDFLRPSGFGLRTSAASSLSALTAFAAAEHERRPTPPASSSTPARDSFSAGKLREAEASLETALASQDQRLQPPALYNLGLVRFRAGRRAIEERSGRQADRRARPGRRPASRRRLAPGGGSARRQRRAGNGRRLPAWPGRAQGIEGRDRSRAPRAEGVWRRAYPNGSAPRAISRAPRS